MNFEELYLQNLDAVYRLAFRLLGSRDSAMDATQETFTRAWKAWKGFRGASQPRTWLYRIAYNACMTRLARRAPAPLGPEDEARPDAQSSRPEAFLQSAETARLVRKALDSLQEDDRRVLCLLLEDDLDYARMAELLSCSVEAVRMRASRARRRLRDALEALMEETP